VSKKDPAISGTIDNSDTNRDPRPTPIQTISASENNLPSDNDNAKENNENPSIIQQNIFDVSLDLQILCYTGVSQKQKQKTLKS
jgi:hypothetical protein